ncbi:hypothetical protein O6H91_05G005800 [Diphasiastrum complanatum]|nr:hypothetical protein O6H91_05G005800 [Diphasiastrum complanatum]
MPAEQFCSVKVDSTCKMAEENNFPIQSETLVHMMQSQSHSLLKQCGGVEAIAFKLRASVETGICGDKVDLENRRKVFGSNIVREKPLKTFWYFVWDAMHDFLLVVLAICAAISLLLGISTEGWKDGWSDGGGITVSILIVVLVTAASDYRQSLQFQALEREKEKVFTDVLRNRRRQKICIDDLVVGDIISLSTGDQVPADGLYISGYSLLIDESSMTGESEPQHVDENKLFLFSGTKVQDGFAKMLVISVGMNTAWGHAKELLCKENCEETPMQQKLSSLAILIGNIGMCFALLTFILLMARFLKQKENLWYWSSQDFWVLIKYFSLAVTIVVVAVPEGLPLAVTLALAYAMRRMILEKALVRRLSACETMGSATCICTDKTGTLTTNQMTVLKACVGGVLWQLHASEPQFPDNVLGPLLQGLLQNNSSDVVNDGTGKQSCFGSPTEIALLRFGISLGTSVEAVRCNSQVLKVEPFNSTKKLMGTLLKLPEGKLRAHIKGASELVLDMCDTTIDADGNQVFMDERSKCELNGIISKFAHESLRTLCLAFQDIPHQSLFEKSLPREGYACLAIVGIKDPIRVGVKDAVQLCSSAGIRVIMVTGDNLTTATSVAHESGILTDGLVIDGPSFRTLSSDGRRQKLANLQVMARSSPGDKHMLVKELQAMGEIVAVTGDGTNDAPALHEADVGLAMGISGTEVAKGSADIVILDDNFSSIVNVAKFGRCIFKNIQKFVQFQLTANIAALVLNLSSTCFFGHAPLTTVQLLWINLIMDALGALALATEPPHSELMDQPPVGRKGKFISNEMWWNICAQAGYQLSVLSILQFQGKKILGLEAGNAEDILSTMIFNSFVLCQIFNEFNAREMDKVNVFHNLFGNWLFLFVVVFTLTVQVILVESLGKLANSIPLNREQWLICLSIGSFSLVVHLAVKILIILSKYIWNLKSNLNKYAMHRKEYEAIGKHCSNCNNCKV